MDETSKLLEALKSIVELTHDRRDLASRQVNKIATEAVQAHLKDTTHAG